MFDPFAIPWTVAGRAPLCMEFSRQEYWSGLPFPTPEIFPTQRLNLHLLHWHQPGSPQALGHTPLGTHFPLAECLAVILSSSFRPVLRSCLPSMEPVCTAFSGSQKVICEFSVATASSAPSGRKVTARAKKRRVIRAGENPGLQPLGHSALPSSWHPEGLGAAGPTQA